MEWYGRVVSLLFRNNSALTEGHFIAFPDFITFYTKHVPNPSTPVASSALRISLNTGEGVFYGHKYKVEKVCRLRFWLAPRLTKVTFGTGVRG
jgi:hypothetical protein